MEALIPLLIILITGIVSFFASAKKQKDNNDASQSFAADDETDSSDAWQEAFSRGREPATDRDQRFPGETIAERKEALTEKEEDTEGEEAGVADEKAIEQQPAEKKPAGKPRKKPVKNDKIEAIKARFDVEEAIIYSEIINRKHF